MSHRDRGKHSLREPAQLDGSLCQQWENTSHHPWKIFVQDCR